MSKEVQDQIDAMLAIGDGSEEPVEDPIVDPPVEDLPVDPPVEDPPEDPPVEDPPIEDPPADPPIEDPPVDPPVDDEMAILKEENEKLRKQVEERHVAEPKPKIEPVPEPDPEPAPIEELDFVGDLDLDDLIRDPKAFNALLNKIHTAGVTSARGIQETTLRAIPDIVKSNVTIQSTLRKEVKTFYADNKDLEPFKKVVAAVYEELASENPEWTVAETFKEVEKETRNRLELHKKATDPNPDPKPKPKGPKFANTKGPRQRQKPDTNTLLSEIDEMNTHAK